MSNDNRSVEVYYKSVDGGHFFWSKDVLAEGLLVSDLDLNTAVGKVTESLKERTHCEWVPDVDAQNLISSLESEEGECITAFLAKDRMKLPVSWTKREQHDTNGSDVAS